MDRPGLPPGISTGRQDRHKALVVDHVAHHDIRQPVTHGGDRVAAALQAHAGSSIR